MLEQPQLQRQFQLLEEQAPAPVLAARRGVPPAPIPVVLALANHIAVVNEGRLLHIQCVNLATPAQAQLRPYLINTTGPEAKAAAVFGALTLFTKWVTSN